MRESVDVPIIGAGHAGLAMSSFLTHEGRDHVVLERPTRSQSRPGALQVQ